MEGDRLVRAAIVGTDLSTALAVVKVDQNDMDRRPLELGSFEAVRAGDPVLALGNPFGLETR